jgi:uncharacterized protein (TIGR00369 family)
VTDQGRPERPPEDGQNPPAGHHAHDGATALPPAAIHDRLGIQILAASPERVVGTMPVDGNTQPFGLLHGGASCVLAESLGSIGATLHAMPDRIAVGTDLNATHHRAASRGTVTGTATALHLGRTIASYEVVICDAADHRLCTARITCLLVPANR